MKIKDNVTLYEDFKYVMQDVGNIYLGAAYTYQELLEQELTPFKLKAILTHYILKETEPGTTLESQFYYLESNSFLYETFMQLKARVKVQIQVEKKRLFGKKRIVYEEKILSLQEITGINLARKKATGMIIREIIISKMAMMTFSV